MVFQKIDEAEFDDPEFDYVVEIDRDVKVCFGSTVLRCTDPIGKGLSPHQKRIAIEIFPKTGPGCYRTEDIKSAMADQLYKIRSTAGVPPLASKSDRFQAKHQLRTPSPGRYEKKNYWVVPKKSAAPFGVGSKVRVWKESNVPGPMTYDIRKIRKCRRPRKMNNFGKPLMIPCVEIICTVKPTHACQKCSDLCQGDYWHREYETFFCQICWSEEKRADFESVRGYKKMRNCSFMHNHEGTDAAERILPLHKINKKIRIENYLEEYIKC